MKYLKKFEYNIFNPDYVIINPRGIKSEPTVPKIQELFYDFINNNIGIVITKVPYHETNIYAIGYDNVPKKLLPFFMYNHSYTKKYYISVREEKIIKKSKDKEELEAYINSKKYNL